MAQSSIMYYSADVADSAVRVITLCLDFESAGVPKLDPRSNAAYIIPSGVLPTQNQIDDFLGTTSENHHFPFPHKIGEFQLTVMDNFGNEINQKILIKE